MIELKRLMGLSRLLSYNHVDPKGIHLAKELFTGRLVGEYANDLAVLVHPLN